MKTTRRLFLSLLLSWLVPVGALAFDLWVDGIYYNILSTEERTVEVTHGGGSNSYSNWVDVPGQVEHGGRTYRVVGIGENAFYRCRDLIDITVAEGVEYVAARAFGSLQEITKLTLPKSLTNIQGYAFADSKALKTVTINGVVSIGEYAFAGCSALTTVSFKGNVTSIGENAFDHCGALTQLNIPSGVTSIGDNAFLGCYALTSFKVSGSNEHFCSQDGVIYDKQKTRVVAFPNGKGGAYTLPSSVKAIGDCAFAGCKQLQSLTIPSGCDAIGFAAFNRCQSLKQLTNLARQPQVIRDDTFATYGTLHVQKGCKQAYLADENWAKFKIVEDAEDPQETGISRVGEETAVPAYRLDGQVFQGTIRKGVYIRGGRKFVF